MLYMFTCLSISTSITLVISQIKKSCRSQLHQALNYTYCPLHTCMFLTQVTLNKNSSRVYNVHNKLEYSGSAQCSQNISTDDYTITTITISCSITFVHDKLLLLLSYIIHLLQNKTAKIQLSTVMETREISIMI